MQDRRGPNRAGPFGILQPLADGIKLFFKEEIIPIISSKFLFILVHAGNAHGNDDKCRNSLGKHDQH